VTIGVRPPSARTVPDAACNESPLAGFSPDG
jgi:hypothetical protein